MTINIADNSPRVSYSVADGVTQTSFTVSFEFFDNDDLNVYVDGVLKTLITDYTVTGGDGSTGTVTMSVTGASGGSTVVITRDIDLERTTDFPPSGAFNIATLNTELDRLVAIAADLEDRAARAIQAQDFDSTVSYTLPLVDDRKGKVLGFNATTGAVEAGPEIADTQSLADVSADIALLADIEDGTTDTNAITNLNGVRTDVTTVSGISGNVTTVANNDANVTTVATNDANITTVATNIASVNTVATNIADVITVANDLNEAISEVETVANDLNESISEIETVAASITNVDLVGTDITNVNTTAGSISNINTTATNIANVNTVAGISGNVTTVAGISSDVTAVAADQADIGTVSTNITNVNTVAGISGNVTTVAGISGNVTTVANNDANVTTVAGINSAVSTVAGISTDVTAVSNNNANVTTVAGSIANVNTAATDITNINTAATNISVINTVATAITDVSTVSADIASVITAANDLNEAVSEIETVANAITNVDAVGTNITNVNTVAGISSDVTTVANDGTDIGTVATNIANVNTVAGISGNVTTVAGISTDVTAVAADAADIGTVSTDISNVNTVAGSISNVNTVATNINNVNDFFNVYRVGSTDPTTSLDTGDLFYNTTSGSLKVYTGSAWEQGVTAGSGFLPLTGGQLTGNITFSGTQTVDGRDLSADGAKLDGIEANATADQTASEIRALVESATDSNVFTDADHTKLNGIEAGATADQTKADIDALGIAASTATTLASLTSDPNDDRIVFWDDSASNFAYLDIGSNLTLSGTTLSANTQSPIAGTGISVSGQTVSLDGTSTIGAGTYGSTSNQTKIDNITIDAYGRVTAVTTGTTGDITTVAGGTGVTVSGGTSGTATVNIGQDVSTTSNVTFADVTADSLQSSVGNGSINFSSNTVQILADGEQWTFNSAGLFFQTGGSIYEQYDALSGTSPTCNLYNASAFSLTMTGLTTFTFSGAINGYSNGFVLQLTGNGSEVVWPTSVDWAGGTAPDAPASGETDIYVFWTRNGGTTWYGVQSIDAAA